MWGFPPSHFLALCIKRYYRCPLPLLHRAFLISLEGFPIPPDCHVAFSAQRCWPQPNLTCMLCTRGEDVTVRPLFCFEGNVLPFSASMVVPNLHLQGIKHEGVTLIIISCLKQETAADTDLKQKRSNHAVIPEVNLFGLFP